MARDWNSDDLISVITPTYNSVESLELAITSIMAQDYDRWEHIVIDGQSTDGTLSIVKKFPHIRLISEPDNGVYDAMNKGISMAEGDWIYFLGSDDEVYSSAVFSNISKFFQNGLDVIFGDVVSSRFGGRYDGPFDNIKILSKNICHQAIFFHREIFKKIGLFNIKYPYHSDWEHNFRWFLNPEIKKKYIDIVVAKYGDIGLSSNYRDTRFKCDKLGKYLKYGWKTIPKARLRSLSKKVIKKDIRQMKLSKLWISCFAYIYSFK